MTTAAATSRLELRLAPHDKARITRAASLRGMALSSFARDALLREADAAIAASDVVTLSVEESRRFLAALDKPFRPNKRLAKAMALAAKVNAETVAQQI